MFDLDGFISDLEYSTEDILNAYANEDCVNNKAIKRIVLQEIGKYLEIAAMQIEARLDELEGEE